MAWNTNLILGTSTESAADRILDQIHLDALRRDLRGGYDELSFHIPGAPPAQIWSLGLVAKLQVNIGDGNGMVTRFKGEITDLSWGVGPLGWIQAYTCQGIKYQADRVPVTAVDGTGDFVLNRTPDDPLYDQADAGLTIGQIFTRVLTVPVTANALAAAAIGIQYASLSPPTLAAATVADFALLTVVPPQPVYLGGEGIFNTLDQILARWMPKFVLEIQPDGTVRAKDTTDTSVFVPHTLTLPSPHGIGTLGAQWPRIRASTARCASRVVIRGGPIVAATLLSTADGTLAPAWSGADQTAWTLFDFTQPKNAKDSGTISSITGNTATVTPADATETWATNYWAGQGGFLWMTDPVASGIAVTEYRAITANTSLAAGGTSTITWDASQPLASSSYSEYRVVATAGPRVDVSRLFTVREPSTGHLGVNTYVGAHLVVRSALPIPWANNSTSLQINYPTALVVGGTVQAEVPLPLEVLPAAGEFRLRQPAVSVFGTAADLEANGYPATTAKGLPTDVQVLALYSRGALSAPWPADIAGVAQHAGTAHTQQLITATKYIDVPAYLDQWSQASMAALAQQHQQSIQDVVYEGRGEFYGEPSWDVFVFNYSLNYAIAGTTSPWSAINAPVRAFTLRWPQGEGCQHEVTFEFSTQRRPFAGDDLYLHPSFTRQSMIGTGFGGVMPQGFMAGGGVGMGVGGGLGAGEGTGGDGSGFGGDFEPPARTPLSQEEQMRRDRAAQRDRLIRQKRERDAADAAERRAHLIEIPPETPEEAQSRQARQAPAAPPNVALNRRDPDANVKAEQDDFRRREANERDWKDRHPDRQEGE